MGNPMVEHDPEKCANGNDKESTVRGRYLKAKCQAALKRHSGAKNQLFSND
jgi:hypothetical protein